MHCYKLDTAKWPKNEHFNSAHYLFFRDFLSQEINLKLLSELIYKGTLPLIFSCAMSTGTYYCFCQAE